MKNLTTIFYENSAGIMSQWVGEVIKVENFKIDIRFSKNKALRYDLKLNSGFMLVTKTKVEDFGINAMNEAFSQDQRLRDYITERVGGNVAILWDGTQLETKAKNLL